MIRNAAVTPLVAVSAGVLALVLVLAALGYDPAQALATLVNGAFGSWYAFSSSTLVRATPLILLGLGFGLAFRGGALNIGMEGQFLVGAIAATWVGVTVDRWPAPAAVAATWALAVVAGMFWVSIPILLKLRYGVLEVITTLLLNFVAAAVVSWMVQGPLQEARRSYPQSDLIAEAARLPMLPGTRLHLGFGLVLVVAGILHTMFRSTVWGIQLRAVGLGPRAAWMTGRIHVARVSALALLASGALAGLGGALEIGGVTWALYQNLSPGYGFTAIAVALLGRGSPLAIVGTGLLFGALQAGAGAMQREAGIPAVAVAVVQGTIILVVLLAESTLRRRRRLAVIPADVPDPK
jgi:simple sugar transport system permease protein